MSIDSAPRLGAPGETLSPQVQAFRLVLALAQQLRTLMDRQLSASGVTTQQAALLTVVDLLGRPGLTEAARAMAMTHQNVKQLATALERKGFLEIVPDEHDARLKRLVTTRRNRAFWTRRNPGDHASVAAWFAELSDAELAQFVQLLAKANQCASAAGNAPRPDGVPNRSGKARADFR